MLLELSVLTQWVRVCSSGLKNTARHCVVLEQATLGHRFQLLLPLPDSPQESCDKIATKGLD